MDGRIGEMDDDGVVFGPNEKGEIANIDGGGGLYVGGRVDSDDGEEGWSGRGLERGGELSGSWFGQGWGN